MCSAADCSAECWLLSLNASPYLLNDSLMSRPDVIYDRIGRPTCATSGITAARLQMKPNRPLTHGWHTQQRREMELILEFPLCDAGAMRLLHELSCSKLSLKNKVSLTLWKNNTGIEWYPGICRVTGIETGTRSEHYSWPHDFLIKMLYKDVHWKDLYWTVYECSISFLKFLFVLVAPRVGSGAV